MRQRWRRSNAGRAPRHTTVVAYAALFIALGGTSVAALSIGSGDIRDNSVRSRDIRNGTLTGKDIKESRLGPVPRARRLNGVSARQLRVRCRAGTVAKAGTCFETTEANAPFAQASTTCSDRNRRLPSHFELKQFAQGGGDVNPAGEWTVSVFESRTTAGQLDTVLVTASGGELFAPAGGATVRPYRCVAAPTN